MIPKRIIYCWFGRKEKPQKVKECMETWKKNLPDWEYLEINEDNFDINYNEFAKEAYKNKAYAFVSDVARLWALYNYGGIYMDTDVIVYKPLDKFLKHSLFTGFEQPNYPTTATFGAEKGHPLVKEMLDIYDIKSFKICDDWTEYETNTMLMSDILGRHFNREQTIYQEKDNMAIYPQEVFTNRLLTKNEESYTEHLMLGNWIGE